MTYPKGESPEEFLTFYRTLSIGELRRRQDLTRQQIVMAHKQHKEDSLTVLRRMEQCLFRAVYEKAFSS